MLEGTKKIGRHRDAALQRLANAAISRPLDMEELEEARYELVTDYSQELLVEAAGMIGISEAKTKIVDATGRKPLPQNVQRFMNCMLRCCKLCH